MEDNKIKIGITQGDINGVGYEVILKTFADPVMLDFVHRSFTVRRRWLHITVNHSICLLTSVLSILLQKLHTIG
jgi:4-hydroxy-L-threonine phosphate dehydrogenase PdxA